MKNNFEIRHEDYYSFGTSYEIAPINGKVLLDILYYVDLIYGGVEVNCLFTNWKYKKFSSIVHHSFENKSKIFDQFYAYIKLPYYYENENSVILKDFNEGGLAINGGFGDTHEPYSISLDFNGFYYTDHDYLWSFSEGKDLLFNNELSAILNRSRMRDILQILKRKHNLKCFQLYSHFIPQEYLSDEGILEGAVTLNYLKHFGQNPEE